MLLLKSLGYLQSLLRFGEMVFLLLQLSLQLPGCRLQLWGEAKIAGATNFKGSDAHGTEIKARPSLVSGIPCTYHVGCRLQLAAQDLPLGIMKRIHRLPFCEAGEGGIWGEMCMLGVGVQLSVMCCECQSCTTAAAAIITQTVRRRVSTSLGDTSPHFEVAKRRAPHAPPMWDPAGPFAPFRQGNPATFLHGENFPATSSAGEMP